MHLLIKKITAYFKKFMNYVIITLIYKNKVFFIICLLFKYINIRTNVKTI